MEYGIYVQHTSEGNMIMACLYVNDILLIESYEHEITKFKKELMNEFQMTDLRNMVYFLWMKLDSDSDGDDVDATTFKQLVGSQRYLCNTKPDICYAVGIVSRFMSKSRWSHYQVDVRIIRYIKGNLKDGILFHSGAETDSEPLSY
ncbi:uncharacterized mitochondrial protein AtMg00810-like [Lathyrus oleraceus]|uniref:uncharacterized mitochondrial protein AtMg00810-like n=1 Tax=Pisum sativum TaxID=3888 RepID=UPI0021D09365|nr:uncharacterized mitochondrial protein AtMg00810-like [Pisum sativum]